MVSFYWSVIAFILLLVEYISYAFPDTIGNIPVDPYQSGISYQMASVIVMLPIFMLLMGLIRRDIVRDPSKREIWVRRWALIFTLFVAGIAMAGDLIMLLTTFLNGEAMTTSFLLKVSVVFLVAAGVFMHFIADLQGYWDTFPMRKRAIIIAVAVLAIASVGSGFVIVGTPQQARLARYDAQKVNDLQNIQMQIQNYFQAKQKLPTAITDLTNTLAYGPMPVDPQSGAAYTYEATGALTFKLCANFNAESRGTVASIDQPVMIPVGTKAQDNWQHAAGQVCFARTIDPSFYPPLTKQL